MMKTAFRKSAPPLIPPYQQNGALQLIVATGIGFIAFHFARVFMLIMGKAKEEVFDLTFPNIGLPAFAVWKHKWWTLFTYGWVHTGFFDWISNVIWLYLFASVMQNITSYKQVVPLFVFALLIGGGCYLISSSAGLDGSLVAGNYFLGSQAGVIALGVAALTLAPNYRVHITTGFGIPLVLIVGIFIVLNVIIYLPVHKISALALCGGGIMTGLVYALALKGNARPGEWIYDLLEKLQRFSSPDDKELVEKKSKRRMEILRTMYEPKQGISQQKIDEILDKINDQGYHSLSRDEKDILYRAGKD
ncbi:MAG: rhomboid family intramembrane serine protease [Bacteroidetes bacterium]|nr:rhomboid family intramembrane serine protease [Bacteroidota bacterium]MBS1739649.1 rhomboid family intramembrane serine protease [Bacteroidota bacterium]